MCIPLADKIRAVNETSGVIKVTYLVIKESVFSKSQFAVTLSTSQVSVVRFMEVSLL